MSLSPLEKKTRSVFHKIHLKQGESHATTSRLRNMLSTHILGVDEIYFHNKKCIDLGAGSMVHGTVNLLEMGAHHVTALDLDSSYLENAQSILASNSSYDDRWSLETGSLMSLPFDSGTFDFALCQGVIHHADNPQKCMDEIARIVSNKGKALVAVSGKGGLVNRFLMELLRDEYNTNSDFFNFVNTTFSVAWTHQRIGWLRDNLEQDDSPEHEASLQFLNALESLVDEDLILSLLDRMQAPSYTMMSLAQFTKLSQNAGFKKLDRIDRRPKYNNIRRLFSSLYVDHDIDLSKILYGDGGICCLLSK